MLAFVSCGDKAEEGKEGKDGDKKEVVEKKEEIKVLKLTFNKEESYVGWESWKSKEGEKGEGHHGRVKISDGFVEITNDELTGGEITVDVLSIFSSDLTKETGLGSFLGHIGSLDIFGVSDSLNPMGAPHFKLTSYEDGVIKGDLTIYGTTNSIEAPASVDVMSTGVEIVSEKFMVDLTKYGMPWYAQDKEPGEDGKAPTIMHPEAEFSIYLVADM